MDITEQLTMETDVQNGLLESLQNGLHSQIAMTDKQLARPPATYT